VHWSPKYVVLAWILIGWAAPLAKWISHRHRCHHRRVDCDSPAVRTAAPTLLAIVLGPLEQTGLLVVTGKVGTTSFGAVQMHGLSSHVFLKRYAWMLDSSERVYIFSPEAQ